MHLPHIQVRESSLNKAILDFARTDFLFGAFDLQALALEAFRPYYADHVAFWLGPELITGLEEALARLVRSLEPIYTFLEMGTIAPTVLPKELHAANSRCNRGKKQGTLRTNPLTRSFVPFAVSQLCLRCNLIEICNIAASPFFRNQFLSVESVERITHPFHGTLSPSLLVHDETCSVWIHNRFYIPKSHWPTPEHLRVSQCSPRDPL